MNRSSQDQGLDQQSGLTRKPFSRGEGSGSEVRLDSLNTKQLHAILGKLVLAKSAWSCFSLKETSRLLRPLQISPDLTGTTVLNQNATAEIIYKFPLSNGGIGTMSGLVSIEDFRGTKLRQLFEQIHVEKVINLFMEVIIIQIVDVIKPVFTREEDEALWQEMIIFSPQDLRHDDFLLRGLRLEAIPRCFRPHLQAIYKSIRQYCPEFPNVAFQLCLRAYLEYNDIFNGELISRLLSKYFYTVYRCGGLETVDLTYQIPTYGLYDRKSRLKALSRILTIDNESNESLEKAGLVENFAPEIYGGFLGGTAVAISPQEVEKLRQDFETVKLEFTEAQRIIVQSQTEEKQDLIKRLSNPDKFLLFSVIQFFEDIFERMPEGVGSDYGLVWVPKTSYLDEGKRIQLIDHLYKVTDEKYLYQIHSSESSIIGYWKTLAESFYNQWVLNQYKRLKEFGSELEDIGIEIVSRDRFVEEVQLRFAARHLEIVQQNRTKIAAILVDKLAQRVAINTVNQTFQAMHAKLNNVLEMDISKSDMTNITRLIDWFEDVFMGKKEEVPSPYPVGTILESFEDLNHRPREGRTLIAMEVLKQIYQRYLQAL